MLSCKLILNALPGLIFVKNSKGEFTYVNPSFCAFYNVEYDYIIGQSSSIFQKQDDFIHNDLHVIYENTSKTIYELKLKNKYFSITKTPITVEDGTIEILAVATDITEKKLQDIKSKESKRNEIDKLRTEILKNRKQILVENQYSVH